MKKGIMSSVGSLYKVINGSREVFIVVKYSKTAKEMKEVLEKYTKAYKVLPNIDIKIEYQNLVIM